MSSEEFDSERLIAAISFALFVLVVVVVAYGVVMLIANGILWAIGLVVSVLSVAALVLLGWFLVGGENERIG